MTRQRVYFFSALAAVAISSVGITIVAGNDTPATQTTDPETGVKRELKIEDLLRSIQQQEGGDVTVQVRTDSADPMILLDAIIRLVALWFAYVFGRKAGVLPKKGETVTVHNGNGP